MMTTALLFVVLAQAPLPADTSQALPPNHPPIGAAQPGVPPAPMRAQPLPPGATLPPNHPPMQGAPAMPPGATMPPNHPQTAGQGMAPSADELIRRLDAQPDLMGREKTFEIATSIGRLYFGQGRYKDAASYFEQAVRRGDALRTLFVEQKKALGKSAAPDPAAVGCTGLQLEALISRTQEKIKAKETGAAVSCAGEGLRGVAETEVVLGHARFAAHDVEGALKTYEHVLELFADDADARYSRAALLLDAKGDDLPSLKLAQADFERFIRDAPGSTHAPQALRLLDRTKAAIAAGGLSKVAPVKVVAKAPPAAPFAPFANGGTNSAPPQLSPEVMQAFQNAPRTEELQGKLGKAVEAAEGFLAAGKYQEALDSYKQVMPYQPDNPRVRAGMAWSLVKLNKQPMADRVWGVATENPDAIATLGDTLKAKGNADGAKEVWKKLADSVPSYASKLQGKL